ncbi:uncharacterized protein LOC135391029 [Ornithodoros turicata]|uniref:uncharacterized protein LOC135391029 n=1 Tax=Ornithodoros turicata TaxID=34597 RepID=UPI003138806A
MTGKAEGIPKPDSFRLQAASDFSTRMDDIFGSLNQLEAKHQAWEHSSHSDNEKLFKSDPDAPASHDRKRDEFKIPSTQWLPPNKRNYSGGPRSFVKRSRTPDYQVHPEKWTKYSLEGVSDADMSEASNKAAALDFLRQRREQQSEESTLDEDVPADRPVIFQRRRLSATDDYEADDKSQSGTTSTVAPSGKLIMPECVVGAKATTKRVKKDVSCRPKADAVKLDYLLDDEDNDDEDEVEDDEPIGMQQNVDVKLPACKVPRKKARYDDVEDDEALEAKEEPDVAETSSSQKRRIRSLRIANKDDD